MQPLLHAQCQPRISRAQRVPALGGRYPMAQARFARARCGNNACVVRGYAMFDRRETPQLHPHVVR